MTETSWEWLTYLINFMTVMAVMLLVMSAGAAPKNKWTAFYLKKICWGVLIISASFWYFTVPFISSFHDFSGNLDYPTASASAEDKYIRDHHRRIETLEDELKETKSELKEIKEHYKLVVRIMWLGVLYFGMFQILKKGDESLNESEENKTE